MTNLLKKTELRFPVHQLPIIYCDNAGATFLSKNLVFHSRVKHVVVDFHFVRHHVEIKKVQVVHVHDADQIADTLTEACLNLLSTKSIQVRLDDPSSNLRGVLALNDIALLAIVSSV